MNTPITQRAFARYTETEDTQKATDRLYRDMAELENRLAAAYEREKVLREGAMRDAALRTVAEEMAGALKLVSVRAVDELKDDPKLQPHSLIVCRLERLTPATAALASYARLQKEKTV